MLLILSALLSALTGAIGFRAPELRSHQTVACKVLQIVPARTVAVRPAEAAVSLADLAAAPPASVFAPAPAIPLYATRRRE